MSSRLDEFIYIYIFVLSLIPSELYKSMNYDWKCREIPNDDDKNDKMNDSEWMVQHLNNASFSCDSLKALDFQTHTHTKAHFIELPSLYF